MKITDIIGKGKYLVPPFKIMGDEDGEPMIFDRNSTLLLPVYDICLMDDEKCRAIADHIVGLLNREHNGK